MLNWIAHFIARFMRTDRIDTQDRDSVAVFNDWSNVLMGCCDCGLMHRYDFFSDDEGRLCVRGRRDYTATLAVRRDREFPFKETEAGESESARLAALALFTQYADDLAVMADELEMKQRDALMRAERARLRETANIFGDESKHIKFFEDDAARMGRRAAAIRALLAQPRKQITLEELWSTMRRPTDDEIRELAATLKERTA